MIAEIEAPIEIFNDILKSLSDTIRGDADVPMDINLVAKPDNTLQIYVRVFNALQEMHKLSNEGEVEIDVHEPHELTFSSQTLYSLIRQVDADRVTLRLEEDNFRVRVGDGWFSTPTEFKLRVFQESEFSPAVAPQGFHQVRSMKKDPLRHRLSMMSSIAPEINFRITSDEFWISVEDQVQGQGKVMKSLSDDADISNVEYRYEIDPIETFLKNVQTEEVDVKMKTSGQLMIKSDTPSHTSYLLLAHRLNS